MPDWTAAHWQRIYGERRSDELSWTEAAPTASLALQRARADLGEPADRDGYLATLGRGQQFLYAHMRSLPSELK
jgi:hypothetical protein